MKNNRDIIKSWQIMLLSLVVFMLAGFVDSAFAAIVPAIGDFAYDIYDITVNKIIQGPIGYVGSALLFVYAAHLASGGNTYGAIGSSIGSIGIIKADDLTQSAGMIF